MYAKIFSLTLLTAAGLGLVNTSTAQAYSPAHVDRLARTLERQTAELHREVHLHFRPSPSYRHLDRDVAEMERLARHIHEVAHHHGGLGHVRRDVEQLDRLYHHVQDQVRTMAVTCRLDRHALAHIQGALSDVGRTLHHLRADLQDIGHGPHGIGGHGGYAPSPYAPSGGIGLNIPLGDRGGITLRIPIR